MSFQLGTMLFGLFALISTVGAQLTVHTLQGDVIGSLGSESPTVRQFLGVPYASAKRWEAPQSPPNRATAINATKFGDTCPQLLNS
jgi:carboxylesterase type B